MDLNRQKEQFSIAWIQALAAVCQLKIFRCDVDDESIDLTLGRVGGNGTIKSPRLDLQLKCSGQELLMDDGVHLVLKRKNYDDLRASDVMIPRVLVVLLVPEAVAGWCINEPEQSLTLHRNAWWLSLLGADDRAGVESPTVTLPRGNVLGPEALTAMVDKVGRGESL